MVIFSACCLSSETPACLRSLLKAISRNLSGDELTVPVRRDHCLTDAMWVMKRQVFAPQKSLRVIACILIYAVIRLNFWERLLKMEVVHYESSGV